METNQSPAQNFINHLKNLRRCNVRMYEHHKGNYIGSDSNPKGAYVQWSDIETLIKILEENKTPARGTHSSLKKFMQTNAIYVKLKHDMAEEVKNSDIIDHHDVKKVEQNFLLNEIAKLKLEIEYLKQS